MKHLDILKQLATLTLVGAAAIPSIAEITDDTAIFFNTEVLADTEAFQPNVLFIFDTSGSMADTIKTQAAYEPATDYGGLGNDTIYVYNSSYDYRNVTIDPSRNSCLAMLDHIAAYPSAPTYTGKAANWSEYTYWSKKQKKYVTIYRWEDVENSTETVECKDDAGTHGVDAASTDIYAADGNNGPYTTSANDAISWNKNTITSNRLYVSANYHWYLQTVEPATSRVKMDVMKEAAKELVNEFTGLNFGLMRFDGEEGGYVKHHFSDIETDRANIITKIDELTTTDWTPLTETLWEAHKYFLGGEVEYGTNSNRDPAAVSGDNYNSPIAASTNSCQKNYIVYLTDGTPWKDSGKDSTIRALTNTDESSCKHYDDTSSPDKTCLDELAGHMATKDYNIPLLDKQNVETYTIGFNIDMPLLQQTAIAGQGEYYTASSTTELKTAFNKILQAILSQSTSFTAPAVSVNAFNSLQHRDEVYYALFEPTTSPRWYGNVKKYRIDTNGDIRGEDGSIAVGSSGYFEDDARSFWLEGDDDGEIVQKGGVASKLTNIRTVYTVAGNPTDKNIPLNAPENTITVDNDLIANTLYGLDDAAPDIATSRPELIKWILGEDTKNPGNASHYMADPLHSRPIVVTYAGADNIITDDTLFATTNDGAFHAVNTETGEEKFAFIPQDLLTNQLDYKIDDPDGIRRYGLDGPMTIWRQESTDDDITIDAGDGDHVYAYFGMRRGGKNYYALDVTSKDNPKVMWSIFGGITAGFSDLGQTWSKPTRTQVNWGCNSDGENCVKKDVLFFAAGYDTIHDNATAPTTGDAGAAIYMVDPETGELLWSAGNNDNSSDTHKLNLPMKNSIPGDVTVADMNSDGVADILFAVDILGHVWRIDFNSKTTSAADFTKIDGVHTGDEIADLTDSTGPTFRRFYVGPTVSLSQKRGREPFFVITMGTGYTAQPRDLDIVDRLYAVFERSIFGPPKNSDGDIEYTTIDNGYLLNLTDPGDGPADPEGNAVDGFYKNATAPGEKFLRPSLTRFGYTVYTSYLPKGNSKNQKANCGTDYLGGGNLYAMNFVTGVSAYSSEFKELNHPGIPPEPVVLLIPNDDGGTDPILCVGTECFSPDDDENPWSEVTTQILYWRENLQ